MASAELYRALMEKNKDAVVKSCTIYKEGVFHIITKHQDTVLHLALYSKQVELVYDLLNDLRVDADTVRNMNLQNKAGNTILHEAATYNKVVKTARRIRDIVPELLTVKNFKGETPLFRSARYGQMKMFNYLDKEMNERFPIEEDRKPFYTRDDCTILHISIDTEHFDLALLIAQKYKYLVGIKDNKGMTALQHIACNPSAFRNPSNGWLKYLIDFISPCCTVPLWDSISKGMIKYEAAMDLAKLLIEEDTSWIHEHDDMPNSAPQQDAEVENRRNTPEETPRCETPLILATKCGCYEIVNEILNQHPQTVEHIDEEGSTILHTAIKYRRIDIFNIVEKMGMPMRRLARQTDNKFNSILHMVGEKEKYQHTEHVTRSPAFDLQDDLLLFERVREIIKNHFYKDTNSAGQTAEELFAANNEDLRGKAQEWLKRTAENCSIVAVLIATVAFAAAYTVPGGSNPDGSPVLLNQTFFVIFTISDVLSLTFTLTSVVVFLSILTSSFRLKDFKQSLPQKLILGVTCLIIPVSMMMLAFAATIILMIHNKQQWTRIALYTVAFLPVTMFAVIYLPLYIPLMRTLKYTVSKIKSNFPRFTCCSVPSWYTKFRQPRTPTSSTKYVPNNTPSPKASHSVV